MQSGINEPIIYARRTKQLAAASTYRATITQQVVLENIKEDEELENDEEYENWRKTLKKKTCLMMICDFYVCLNFHIIVL